MVDLQDPFSVSFPQPDSRCSDLFLNLSSHQKHLYCIDLDNWEAKFNNLLGQKAYLFLSK